MRCARDEINRLAARLGRLAGASAVVLAVAGCSGRNTAPTGPKAQDPATGGVPSAPTVVAVELEPDSLVIGLGDEVMLHAVKVMSDGSRVPVPDPFSWSASPADRVQCDAFDDRILAFNPITGIIVGVGVGTATVQVSLSRSGLSTRGSVIVMPPLVEETSTALSVNSFSVLELQYESNPGHWSYVPQLRVSATSARAVTVLVISLVIPGIGDASFGCGGHIPALSARELIGEVYGDWLITFDRAGARATGEDAAGELTWVDETGARGSIPLKGPVAPGDSPPTYTGGSSGGACFHGYGSYGQ